MYVDILMVMCKVSHIYWTYFNVVRCVSVAVAGEARLSCSVVIVYRLLLSMTSVTHALI